MRPGSEMEGSCEGGDLSGRRGLRRRRRCRSWGHLDGHACARGVRVSEAESARRRRVAGPMGVSRNAEWDWEQVAVESCRVQREDGRIGSEVMSCAFQFAVGGGWSVGYIALSWLLTTES
jgi:hypothetical protein